MRRLWLYRNVHYLSTLLLLLFCCHSICLSFYLTAILFVCHFIRLTFWFNQELLVKQETNTKTQKVSFGWNFIMSPWTYWITFQSHLIFVIFCTPPHLYAKNKFATKIASQQNSVNLYFGMQFHIVIQIHVGWCILCFVRCTGVLVDVLSVLVGLLVIYTTNFPLSEDLRILKSWGIKDPQILRISESWNV